MKNSIVLIPFAILSVFSVSGNIPTDPSYNPTVNNQLKEDAANYCTQKCHQNVEDCSIEIQRDLITCKRLLHGVYRHNYEVCAEDCNNCCSGRCEIYIDCESACLRITSEKIRIPSKAPDELIRIYNDYQRKNMKNLYVE